MPNKSKISLLWFKNDLRLLDNESLCNSLEASEKILPVYIFDPRHYRETAYDFPKAGYNRFEFLKQTLTDLRENLKKADANLLIKVGKPEEIIPKIIEKYGISSVFAEQEYAPEEEAVVQQVIKNLPQSCEYKAIWGKTMYHIDDLPYAIDEIPLTSKAFRINTEKKASVREVFAQPEKIEVFDIEDWGELPEASTFDLVPEESQEAETYLKGGETEALKRLAYYTHESELLTSYKWTRNRSLGLDYSSKFSPYLALGAISPRKIHKEVKLYEKEIKKNISTWWLIFEVVWRDYFTFKGMMMGDAIFKTEGFKNKEITFENDTEKFQRWCDGTTGIPFIDAHMRQLNRTGYMSNRGRVNCASYMVHDLKIDWTWGAAYFESKLIDYDVSSNWMNWHMQAYEIWYTNPVHQSLKYKAIEFIQKWVSELASVEGALIYAPWQMGKQPTDYPAPIEVYSKWSRSINNILKAAEKE
ncbi:DASH family cryptochrome [Flavimarina sp. Hel_I_48]|uniref:DASH family cryptochrome n=1 Tax=Flavimarina sp. Hel_I_48 TaxID=1392488 RepID=UPI0004DF7993|nr:DASH family cryptochrome [Flavimarina sp. Hel_I_48]